MTNHGFIDPEEPMRTRVDALERQIDLLLRHLDPSVLHPIVQQALRQGRAGDWSLARQIMADAERDDPLAGNEGMS